LLCLTSAHCSALLYFQAEAEAEYKKLYPDWTSPFASIPGLEEDAVMNKGDANTLDNDMLDNQGAGGEDDSAEGAEASEAEAKTSAARQLLDGELLSEVVALHGRIFRALAAGSTQSTTQSTALTLAPAIAPAATRAAFTRAYDFGTQLLAGLGPGPAGMSPEAEGLTVGLDEATLTGHLYR
jgi:midasin